jgi:hypothetical protein
MELEIITLSQISQAWKDKLGYQNPLRIQQVRKIASISLINKGTKILNKILAS